MTKKTNAAKQSGLANLNIVAGCRVQIINFETERYQTIAETVYTPRHINDVLKSHKLQSAWIYWLGGRELWHVGKQLATHS